MGKKGHRLPQGQAAPGVQRVGGKLANLAIAGPVVPDYRRAEFAPIVPGCGLGRAERRAELKYRKRGSKGRAF